MRVGTIFRMQRTNNIPIPFSAGRRRRRQGRISSFGSRGPRIPRCIYVIKRDEEDGRLQVSGIISRIEGPVDFERKS